MRSIVVVVLVLSTWASAFGQASMQIADDLGTTGNVLLGHSVTQGINAWGLGVCHDTSALQIDAIFPGIDLVDLEPAFDSTTVLPEGWTATVVIDFLSVNLLSPIVDFHAYSAQYSAFSPGPTDLTFCQIGNPPVENLFATGSATPVVPSLSGGTLQLAGTSPETFLAAPSIVGYRGEQGIVTAIMAGCPDPVAGFALTFSYPTSQLNLTEATFDGGIAASAEFSYIDHDSEEGHVTATALADVEPPFDGLTFSMGDGAVALVLECSVRVAATPGFYSLGFLSVAGEPPVNTVFTFPDGTSVLPSTLPAALEVLDGEAFRRGECNSDGTLDISDAIFLLGWFFANGQEPVCNDACDSNDDGLLDISDILSILLQLFEEGFVASPPGPDCGVDPTSDALGCAVSQLIVCF